MAAHFTHFCSMLFFFPLLVLYVSVFTAGTCRFALLFSHVAYCSILMLNHQSVQSHSHVRLFATPRTALCQASLSITNSRSLPKLMSIESVMPSNHLILCCPLLLLPQSFPALGSFLMSQLFASSGQSIGFSFNISPSNEHPALISFRMDWLDLLAVQGTLKSLLQHHTSKASILQRSVFFMVQLSHSYMTTG